MDKFEMRICGFDDIWSDWSETRDHAYVAEHMFSPRMTHIQSIRYTYKDGTAIEYRRKDG
jgi:hypothetical protein